MWELILLENSFSIELGFFLELVPKSSNVGTLTNHDFRNKFLNCRDFILLENSFSIELGFFLELVPKPSNVGTITKI